MANHVPDPSSQNAAMFSDFNYNNFYDQGQTYGDNLAPNQQHHTPQLNGTPSHSPFNNPPAFSPPPAWQNGPTPTSIPNPQGNPYLTANRGYYGGQPQQNSNPYFSAQGAQYGHHVDPSLLRQPNTHTYSQSLGVPATISQPSSTIAPSSLHQTTHRPAISPGLSMQNIYSMQNMGQQPRPVAAQLPTVNGSSTVQQTFKVPRGTQQGNFIIVPSDELANATKSRKLAKYANISSAPADLNITKVNIPPYVPRKSHNELKALAASDPTLKAKIMKRVKKTKIHAPRIDRPMQTATSKDSPVSLSSETESSSDESESEYESDASPPPEKSPLPVTRPQKAVEAVRYDTIKAVWLPRNKFAPNDLILKGLADLWEVVRTIRDRWKADKEAVKKATEAKQESELPLLRERVDKQLEMMEAVLKAASEFGHADLLGACGQNSALMAVCYQFLLEPVREGNYTSTFIKAVFKFLSLCANLGPDVSEKTGLSKLFTRSVKRGTDEIKALTAKINENIAATDKRNKAARSTDKSLKVASSPKPKQEPESVAGVKRARPLETTAGQPAKRVASSAVTPVTKESAVAKHGLVKKAGAPSAAPPVIAKTKIVKPPTTTTSFFGLQSASKRPGTSKADATKKVAPGATAEKKATPVIPLGATRPAFSFAETMANLSKAKEVEKKPTKKEEENKYPNETPEEKVKRLRKEERRVLRVRWKPDFDLVEVRTFSPDPSEMSGKARNVRDVGNGKEKEGATLKKHLDMMDVDEEGDDQPMEQTFFDYRDPSQINFITVPEDERARNYERFGGQQKVDSPERAVQDNHEANTLMVHYLAKSDIPPTPREPADPYNGPQVETKDFGYPDESSPWLIERLKANPPPPPIAAPQFDISALLQSINAPAQAQQPAASIPNLSGIQGLLQSISSTATQPEAAPQQGYSWPAAAQQPAPAPPTQEAPQTNSLESILASLTGGAAQQQQVAPAPAPPMLAPPTATAPPAQAGGAPTVDVHALMAQLMQNAQQPANTAAAENPYAPYMAAIAGAQAQGQDYSNYYNAASNPYGYAAADSNANDNGEQGGKREWKGNASKKYTHPCRFWKDGKCKKGDACTFRHD